MSKFVHQEVKKQERAKKQEPEVTTKPWNTTRMPCMPVAEEDYASFSDMHLGKSSSCSIELSECVDSTYHSLATEPLSMSHVYEPQVWNDLWCSDCAASAGFAAVTKKRTGRIARRWTALTADSRLAQSSSDLSSTNTSALLYCILFL